MRRILASLLSLALIAPGPSFAASLRSAGTVTSVSLPAGIGMAPAAMPLANPAMAAAAGVFGAPAPALTTALPALPAVRVHAPAIVGSVTAQTAGTATAPAAAAPAAPGALATASGLAASAPEKSGEALDRAYDASSSISRAGSDSSAPVLVREVLPSRPAPTLGRRGGRAAAAGAAIAGLFTATTAFAVEKGAPAASASWDPGLIFTLAFVGIVGAIWGLSKWHSHRQNKDMERVAREIEEGTYEPGPENHVFHSMGPGVAGNAAQTAAANRQAAPVEPKGPLFKDVAGQDEAKMELEEVVDFLKNPDDYRKLHPRYKGPKGVLVFGPPGTGKTMLARAVANEAEVPFVHRAGSDFINTYVGKGADNIREAFKEVRAKIKTKGGAGILFIDEIEAIGGARTGNSDRSEETRTINALLKEMDGFEKDNIIVIAATNMPDSLDPALMRGGRFGSKIPVGLPDVVGRKAVLDIHLKGAALAPDVDAQALAKQTPGLAGADLEQVVMDATKLAKRRGAAAIAQQDLVRAIDEFTTGKQRKLVMSESDKRTVAFHESGHAIVSHLLPDADPVRKVTIIPHGLNALGFMQAMPEEEKVLYSYEWLADRIAVALGGRVAEKMMTGHVFSGAQNDLQQATRMAKMMVMQFGMSGDIGHVSYDMEGTRPAVGGPMSEATRRRIDAEVKRIIQEQLDRVEKLLTEYKGAVQQMADELMEKETLRSEDMERIVAATKAAAAAAVPPAAGDKPAAKVVDEEIRRRLSGDSDKK